MKGAWMSDALHEFGGTVHRLLSNSFFEKRWDQLTTSERIPLIYQRQYGLSVFGFVLKSVFVVFGRVCGVVGAASVGSEALLRELLQRIGQIDRLAQSGATGHDPVGQAPLEGFLTFDGTTSQDHVHGPRKPYRGWQSNRPTVDEWYTCPKVRINIILKTAFFTERVRKSFTVLSQSYPLINHYEIYCAI